MSSAHVVRTSAIAKSFRVDQVRGMFDVPNKEFISQEWDVSLPIEEREWNIGLIVGASGSGKTTIAKEIFKDSYFHESFVWNEKAMIDNFKDSIQTKEVVEVLSSVGLSSPPHWLKPFAHLSNGQKFRAELARCILENHDRIVFDEFTSVVDRDVAKICSVSLSKTIRRRQRAQFVAISCHFDIIDWLQPDWIFDVASNRFEWRELRRFPEIKLSIHQTDFHAWNIFKGHHYLSADLNHAAKCFIATIDEKPVAFCAVLHHPHSRSRVLKREHRTVVLPDFQGIGIGNRLSEAIAEHFRSIGFRFISTTSHPSMIHHRSKSKKWKSTIKIGHKPKAGKTSSIEYKEHASNRLTASFEYVG